MADCVAVSSTVVDPLTTECELWLSRHGRRLRDGRFRVRVQDLDKMRACGFEVINAQR